MARETVPEHEIITCDRCGAVGKNKVHPFVHTMAGDRAREDLGYKSDREGPFDLCCLCAGAFDVFMANGEVKPQRIPKEPTD